MTNHPEPAEPAPPRTAWLPAAEPVQADAVAAALDKVLLTPSLSNRVAAFAAVQAYLAATEHLWKDDTITRAG